MSPIAYNVTYKKVVNRDWWTTEELMFVMADEGCVVFRVPNSSKRVRIPADSIRSMEAIEGSFIERGVERGT